MSQKKILNLLCTFAIIQEGTAVTKISKDAAASLDRGELFVDCNWRYKLKTMTELAIDRNVITIHFDNKTKLAVIQLNASPQNDKKEWDNFVKKLGAHYDKIRRNDKRAGFATSRGTSTAAPSNRKTQSHQMPWDSREQHARKKTKTNQAIFVNQQPFHSTQESSLSRFPAHETLVEETNSRDAEEQEAISTALVYADEEPTVEEDVLDVDDLPINTTNKRRIKRKTYLMNDQDSDDDIFYKDRALLTTPAANHIVSPATAALPKKIEDDDDDERTVDENSVVPLQHQPQISSFFSPVKASLSSPPKSKPSQVLTPILSPTNKTPERPMTARKNIFHSSKNYGVSQRSLDMVQAASHQKKDTTTTTHPIEWLLHSQSKRAQSSADKRRELFCSPTMELLSDPIIEDDPSDPDHVKPSITKRKWLNPSFKYSRRFPKSGKTLLSTTTPNHPYFKNTSNPDPTDELPHYRGLRNLGNTCYMNSSLQMLYSCRAFMSALQQSPGGALVQSVCHIYRELQRLDLVTAVEPTQIKHVIDQKTQKFLGYEQRDAHEFLSDLIDHLDEEIKTSTNSEEGENTALDSPIPTNDFCLTVRAHLQCTTCGYLRHKDEMHRCLSVDIVQDPKSGEASIESSVKRFFEPELREIKCEKCTDGTHANQSLSIATLPKILLLHLKRFIFAEQPIQRLDSTEENKEPNSPSKPVEMEYIFTKNKAEVDISPTLDLTKFSVESKSSSASPMASTRFQRYELKSIVRHIGRMASSGHYTADSLRPNNEPPGKMNDDVFVTFDDHRSRRTTQGDVIGKRRETPYMVMYEVKISPK